MEIKNKKEALDALAAITKWIKVQTRDNTSRKEETESDIDSLEFVDLGLPSKTIWATENIKHEKKEAYFTFNEAVEKFGDNLPQKEDWAELFKYCSHKWDDDRKGCVITGPNGNSIFLPAAGYHVSASVNGVGSYGGYWSGTPISGDVSNAYDVYFGSGGVDPQDSSSRYYYGFSVRLARKPKNLKNI